MELWDVYNNNREKTGRTHQRGKLMAAGDYHLVVHIWIRNSRNKYLITKRTPNKDFPNLWECTGGSAVVGDTSLDAALREVQEETGLNLDPKNGRIILSYRIDKAFAPYFCDIWFFKQDFELSEVVFQEGETCDAKWATEKEIRRMIDTGEFVPVFDYIDKVFEEKEKDN